MQDSPFINKSLLLAQKITWLNKKLVILNKKYYDHLTRTIWVSCLSHFLLLFLPSRQICNGCCTRTPAFAEATAVKARICMQLKSYTVINYCLRDSLYRDTAPVPAIKFVTGDRFPAPINLVTRHSYNSQNLYLDGK